MLSMLIFYLFKYNFLMNQRVTKISKIYNDIIEDINNGKYQVGAYLFSEKKLCTQYDASRQTIRTALDILKYDGYILKSKGKKSLILSRHAYFKPKISSVKHQVISSGKVLTYKNLDYKFINNQNNKNHFNLDEPLHFVKRIRLAEKNIMLISNAFISNRLVPEFNINRFSEKDKQSTLVNTLIGKHKIDFKYNKQIILAISLNQEDARILKLPSNTPAFSHTWFFYNSYNQLVLSDEEIYTEPIKIANILHN
jgi:DNA-binding GntR family transcriptional regulator